MLANELSPIPAGAVGAGALVPGGIWGMLGSDILASSGSGEHGSGLAGNDGLAPGVRYVYLLDTRSAATVVLYPDSSHEGPVPYSGTIRLFEQGTGDLGGTLAQRTFSVSVAPYAGVLPNLVQPDALSALAATYTPPLYAGALPAAAAGRVLSALAGAFTGPGASGVVPGAVVGSTLAALAGSYTGPVYIGVVAGLSASRQAPAVAGSYGVVSYTGAVPPMVLASVVASPSASFVEGWKQALKEYTLLAPVDQIDNLGGFAKKAPEGKVTLAFEFKRFTPSPLNATITLTQVRGPTDPAAQAVLDGAPAIFGTRVFQRVKAGVHNCDYKLTCVLNDVSGAAYVNAGVLPVFSQ
jgi:hypothetical protein